jgi:hypothetical protein
MPRVQSRTASRRDEPRGAIKRDSRRLLYRDFLRFVDQFQPQVFVMENVLWTAKCSRWRVFHARPERSACARKIGRPSWLPRACAGGRRTRAGASRRSVSASSSWA